MTEPKYFLFIIVICLLIQIIYGISPTVTPKKFLKFEIYGDLKVVNFKRKIRQLADSVYNLVGYCKTGKSGCIMGEAIGSKRQIIKFKYWLTRKYNQGSTVFSHNIEMSNELPKEIPKEFRLEVNTIDNKKRIKSINKNKHFDSKYTDTNEKK